MCEAVLSQSIIGRGRKAGALAVFTHNIRDYTLDKHRRVDDAPYGGGMGMLMQIFEHNSSKRIRTGYRQRKFTESRTGSISENFLICLIKQHFL